jgi:phosphoribosylglycinamide formyltransferase 1
MIKEGRKIHIAVLASGSGTNAENIINYFNQSANISVSLIISNKTDAFVLQRAARMGIPSLVIPSSAWKEQDYVSDILHQYQIDFLVLAGYLVLIPSWLVKEFSGRIINIHPSLLPKYGGKGMYGDKVHQAVVDSGDQVSGITIHQVNEHYDEGDVVFQAQCPVYETDTAETLAQRIHKLEYEFYPQIIEKVALEYFKRHQ